ncbi:MAG: hypothetical protein L7S72_00845 [Flavobacteriales bacterium]|jgi:hypothetical protein|nr:hypothetical protein [Flavobacteriales bacterium]
MENNKQNLITKIVTYSIAFLGILFTVWVMNDDNPAEMSYEQQKQWAIVEAKSQGLANKMTASELNAHLSNRTSEISLEKEKTLWSDVSKLINFSMFIIYFAVGLVVAAFGYLYFIDSKKAIRTLAGIGIFTVFMVLIYVFSEGDGGTDMKMASTAINATIVLTSIAILGWIGGSLVKFIK